MRISDEYPDGIQAYEHLALTDVIHFPKGRVCCKFCKFCEYDRNTMGQVCRVTKDTLYVIDKGVGVNCPLERIENDGNE